MTELPPGWSAWEDPRSSRVYYQNSVFKTTQWKKPLNQVPPECLNGLPPGWTASIDKRTGQVYYQNHNDHTTQWDKPEEMKVYISHEFTPSEEKFIDSFGSFKDLSSPSTNFEFGECAVCYESLFENRPTVLTDGRRRVCRHFICNECAEEIMKEWERHCPLCRTKFAAVKVLPDIRRNPKEWYDICDQDGTGELKRQELSDALTAILPIEQSRIERDLDLLWKVWDHDNTTVVKWDRAAETVIPYVIRKIDLPQFQQGAIPDLRTAEEQSKWFDYWDTDSNGILNKQELARGLLKTFEQYMTKKKVRKLVTNLLEDLWTVLVGEDKHTISIKDFTKQDGFAATVGATLRDIMIRPVEDQVESSSSVRSPLLCPPIDHEGNQQRWSMPRDYQSGISVVDENKENSNSLNFHGYFTAPPINPNGRLHQEESDNHPICQV